jgi:prepilin-type N-terminal cleavage/methylation domain-containing protein
VDLAGAFRKKSRARRALPAARGFGMLEVVIALSLFAIALAGLEGLFLLSLSSATVAQTSSVATNLARARLEELLAMPRPAILAQADATSLEHVPPGGLPYTVHTAVVSSRPGYIDITVSVAWKTTLGAACAAGGSGNGCRGSSITRTRTLVTRIEDPESP